jgi:hypothetical protein
MARPIEWTPEEICKATEIIFNRIMSGESVRKILNSGDESLPCRKLFYEWMAKDKELSDHYARMMEIRSDEIADETIEIADGTGNDIITLPDGREVEDQRVIARDRLRVDTRKWLLAKLHPKKYGDKVTQELTGAGGKDLIPQTIKWGDKTIEI